MTEARTTLTGTHALGSTDTTARVTSHGVHALVQQEVPARVTFTGVHALVHRGPLADGCLTTIAWAWKITRSDGTIYRFTSLDVPLIFDGQTWNECDSLVGSAIEINNDVAPANMDVMGVIDDATITEDDIRAGLFDGAAVQVWAVDWSDTTRYRFILAAIIGQIKGSRSRFSAELRGLLDLIQVPQGRVVSPECRADLGDARCQVDVDALAVSTTVDVAVSRRQIVAGALTQADNYWQYGTVEFTSGDNDGLSKEIKTSQNTGNIVLSEPFPYEIAIGDDFDIRPGCGKRRGEDCRDKFANAVNFQGEPDLPGLDELMHFPDAQ